MKELKPLTVLTVICLIFAGVGLPNTVAAGTYYSGLAKWNYILYRITDSNQSASVSWYTDTGQSFTWRANRSSHVLYEFQFVGGKGPSPYDPNKIQAWGNIYIGNLTRHDATMYEVASNLALSIYPWYPGFLTSVNWTGEQQQAQNGNKTLIGSLIVTNGTGTYFGKTVQTITFDFKQKNRFQNTTLTYDRTTGALVYGKLAAGNYKLELVAIDSDVIASSSPTPITLMQILTSTLMIAMSLVIINRQTIGIKHPKARRT